MLTLPPSVSIYMEFINLNLQLKKGKNVQDVFDKDWVQWPSKPTYNNRVLFSLGAWLATLSFLKNKF